jgi:hypothetical protein
MSKPIMELLKPETKWFQPNRPEVKEFYRRQGQAAKDQGARERLTRESNLTTAPKYHPCPDGCGMTLLWSNPGHHPMPEDLNEAQSVDDFVTTPVEPPRLRDAVSQAQVMWSRDMIAQYPRKSREQIERENNISWAQLEHFARTPLTGLPERSTKQAKERAKAEARKAVKPKSAPKRRAKEA